MRFCGNSAVAGSNTMLWIATATIVLTCLSCSSRMPSVDAAASTTRDGASTDLRSVDVSLDSTRRDDATPDALVALRAPLVGWGGEGFDSATAVAVDSQGGLYIGGVTRSEALTVAGRRFQIITRATPSEQPRHFLLKLTPNGAADWLLVFEGLFAPVSRFFGGVGIAALAVDPRGDLFIAGTSRVAGARLSNSVKLPRAGGFVAKISATGRVLWAHALGDRDLRPSLAAGKQGEVYVVHVATSKVTIAGKQLVSRGGTDMVIARFEGDGALSWLISAGSDKNDQCGAVAVLPRSGDPVISCQFFGTTVELGTFSASTAAHFADLFARLDARSGEVRWAKAVPGTSLADRIGVDRADGIYLHLSVSGPTFLGLQVKKRPVSGQALRGRRAAVGACSALSLGHLDR